MNLPSSYIVVLEHGDKPCRGQHGGGFRRGDDLTSDDEARPAVGMTPRLPRWRSRQVGRGRRLAARDVPATTRGTMYELYVLGELMEQPVHGYLLPQILSHILGPYRQMSWGALYPLIHRLVQDGLILPWEPTGGGNGGGPRGHAITEAGGARSCGLHARPREYAA